MIVLRAVKFISVATSILILTTSGPFGCGTQTTATDPDATLSEAQKRQMHPTGPPPGVRPGMRPYPGGRPGMSGYPGSYGGPRGPSGGYPSGYPGGYPGMRR